MHIEKIERPLSIRLCQLIRIKCERGISYNQGKNQEVQTNYSCMLLLLSCPGMFVRKIQFTTKICVENRSIGHKVFKRYYIEDIYAIRRNSGNVTVNDTVI